MALSHSPRIVTDGLVLCLDAGNSAKGYELRQNYFPLSEDITTQTGGWVNNSASNGDFGGTGTIAVTTANYGIAPDGTQTADRIQLDKGAGTTTGDRSGIRYNLIMTDRTLSYYIKFLDDTTITDFTTSVYPVGATFSYDTLSNDWYRVKISGSTSNTCRIQYNGATSTRNTLDALVWGVQLNDGNTADDYIKTTGTAVDRSWYDLSGNGNHGTLTNGVSYNSNNGGSFIFDGDDDYVSTNYTETFQNFTLCGFAKANNPGAKMWEDIIDSFDVDSSDWCRIALREGKFSLEIDANSTRSSVTSPTVATAGQWYYVVGVRNGTSGYLYINGVLDTQNSVTGNAINADNDSQFFIGNQSNLSNLTEGWNGNIAQVSIYNRALTASEIQQNFNALRGRYGI